MTFVVACVAWTRTTSALLYRQWGMTVALGVGCVLGGCSSWNNDVAPANVSPQQFEALTCAEISREIRKLKALATPVLFPAKDWEAQRALAKGQIRALEKLSADKKCGTR